jgi:hypothetical protein
MTQTQPDLEVHEKTGPVDNGEPVIDESPEGVDRTMIYHMLSLSPTDRLAMLQGFANSVWALRNGRRSPA